jgi:peptide/nickel transport system substrate-binding protein
MTNISLASDRVYMIAEYSLPDTLDPMMMNNVPSLVASNLIYDGLVRFSPDLTIESDIAKSWNTSLNGKTITFNLNPEAKFHNGEKIEASDVVFSLNRLSSSKSVVRSLYDCIESVNEISKGVVSIKLKWAYPPIFGILAGSTAKILPKRYADNAHYFENPIGSGPFKVSEFNRAQNRVVFKVNDSYFLNKPKLNSIILKSVRDEEEAKKLAISGDADDLSRWPINSFDSVFKRGQKISAPVLETWIFGMVTTKNPFDDIAIRKSFRASFDQEKFRRSFYPEATPAFGYVPMGISGSRSKQIIQDKVSKVSKYPIHIAFPLQLSKSDEMKKFIENEFNSKGWMVTVDLVSWDELIWGYSTKKFQSFFLSMNMDYPDADFLLKNFDSENPDSFSGIKNLKLDKVLRSMRSINDKDKRLMAYKKAIGIVDDMALTINVFHPRNNYWTSKCVRGLEPSLLSSVYIDYRKVYFDEKCINEGGV